MKRLTFLLAFTAFAQDVQDPIDDKLRIRVLTAQRDFVAIRPIIAAYQQAIAEAQKACQSQKMDFDEQSAACKASPSHVQAK